MQQAFYNNAIRSAVRIQGAATAVPTAGAAGGRGLSRWIGQKWDLVGVLALMGSSAVYGLYALSHL